MFYHLEGDFATMFLVDATICLVEVQSRIALNGPYN